MSYREGAMPCGWCGRDAKAYKVPEGYLPITSDYPEKELSEKV